LPIEALKGTKAIQGTLGESPVYATSASSRPPAAVEECWLEMDEGRMRYLKAGSGPPIILSHGLMGYAFSWRFTIPALVPHATVYAIDNLGAGLSTARYGMDCSMRATAERILRFASAVGLGDFDLLGTSHGGGVAMMAAALPAQNSDHSPRVKRLILVAPVNPWSPRGERLIPFLLSPFGSFVFRHTIERWRSLDYLWLRRLFGDESKIPTDSLEGYRLPILQNHVLRHAARILTTWKADLEELEESLPSIRDCPTLLLWGVRDRAVHFESAERLRENFSNARLVTFAGAGHLPYEESPKEFNEALIEFLTARTRIGAEIWART
jgi:abhydrolase domain-containing protein 6